jgi:hypothetical protein
MTHLDAPRPRLSRGQLAELAGSYRAAERAFARGGDLAASARAGRWAGHYEARLARMASQPSRSRLARAR